MFNYAPLLVGFAVAVLSIVVLLVLFRRRQRFVRVGTLSEIWLYPVKSCKGKSVTTAKCGSLGPYTQSLVDRQLMLIKATDRKMVTARDETRLVLVDVDVTEDKQLILTAPDPEVGSCSVDLGDVAKQANIVRAKFWKDVEVKAYDCGDEPADWFCYYLNKPLGTYRLILNSRSRNSSKHKAGFTDDLSPYMLINGSSLDELSSRTKEDMDIRRFRPNLVIRGANAFDEDRWKYLKIGDVGFSVTLPCARCVMTTIDPDSAEKHPRSEPLRTLRQFRLAPEKQREQFKYAPLMGIDLACHLSGSIKVGDPVFAAV